MTGPDGRIPPEAPGRIIRDQLLIFSGVFFVLIIVVVAAGLLAGSPSQWIGHALTATLGLVLLGVVVITGTVRAGRLRFSPFRHAASLHTLASSIFSGIVIGTFVLGLQVTIGHGEEILGTFHGLLGLTVAALSAVQLESSLLTPRRQEIRRFHRILGYLIVLLFLLQILLGLNAAGFIGPNGD